MLAHAAYPLRVIYSVFFPFKQKRPHIPRHLVVELRLVSVFQAKNTVFFHKCAEGIVVAGLRGPLHQRFKTLRHKFYAEPVFRILFTKFFALGVCLFELATLAQFCDFLNRHNNSGYAPASSAHAKKIKLLCIN